MSGAMKSFILALALCACPQEPTPVVGAMLPLNDLGDAGRCSETWSGFAQSFFVRSCSGCHSNLFSKLQVVAARADLIQQHLAQGTMPPRGLHSLERQRILGWFSCGMPP